MKHFLFAAVVTVIGIVVQLQAEDATGLVGHWRLDEGAGDVVNDSGPNQLNGKIYNANLSSWGEGRSGSALFLNPESGSSAAKILISGMKKFDFSKGFTVSAWVYPSKAQKREAVYSIMSTNSGTYATGFKLMIHFQRFLLASCDGDKTMKLAASVFAKNPILFDSWQHLAATHDGNVFKIYLDGELIAESNEKSSGPMTNGGNVLCIGSEFGYQGFPGAISDVKLYNRALTAEEILTGNNAE